MARAKSGTLVERIRKAKTMTGLDRIVNAAVKTKGKLNRGAERIVSERRKELSATA